MTFHLFYFLHTNLYRRIDVIKFGKYVIWGALIEIEQAIARFLFYLLGFLRFEPVQLLDLTRVRRFSWAQANFLKKH
ncbi:MAG: hypothetical protein Athens101426_458 [Parcubacteria group bacterium Athens1014_26]|nr:MAG: hypothetical protein Athens101426_458 [Parcubacteria group bacterium Athens1014_26]